MPLLGYRFEGTQLSGESTIRSGRVFVTTLLRISGIRIGRDITSAYGV